MTDVHIIHHDEDHIIPRMASWLAETLDWSLSNHPRKNAELNYYMPYTAFNKRLAPPTQTAAWFTHLEISSRGKVRQWREAAKLVDLRCTTSGLYFGDLSQKGETAKLAPGIDTNLFEPVDIDPEDQISFLGFGGFGGDRKGTELARRLVDGGWKALASGKNWDGIPTKWFDYDELWQFYNRISIFVCTSTIEGIPAPPLEALACGTRVVIPSEVGVMDELPERPGIRHYACGNYDSLRVAIRRAVYDKNRVDPSELRQIILDRYSKQHWISSHIEAFEQVLA